MERNIDRMPATYVNFYIANGGIVMASFDDKVHDEVDVNLLV